MACVVADRKKTSEERGDFQENVEFGEVLHADDTILLGKEHENVDKNLAFNRNRVRKVRTEI